MTGPSEPRNGVRSTLPHRARTATKAGVRRARDTLPRIGSAGSRSAGLHHRADDPAQRRRQDGAGREPHNRGDGLSPSRPRDAQDTARLTRCIYGGVLGTTLMALGGLGSGAFPVVNNPIWAIPGVNLLAQMLHTATIITLLGIGILVLSWVRLARYATAALPLRVLWRTLAAWTLPLMFTAPLFTQDIYSYLAQGAIAAQGMDPYSAGPADLLGVSHPLARSVPLMWAHSPSPYGPVATAVAATISLISGNNIAAGVALHRLVSLVGVGLIAWALVRLAQRCDVSPQRALWLGALNPLVLLHLVGGIHNEAIMLGLLLVGLECVFAGSEGWRASTVDPSSTERMVYPSVRSRRVLVIAGLVLITSAGLVKITAFAALGFAAVAMARARARQRVISGAAAHGRGRVSAQAAEPPAAPRAGTRGELPSAARPGDGATVAAASTETAAEASLVAQSQHPHPAASSPVTPTWWDVIVAGVSAGGIAIITVIAWSLGTGVGFGWIFAQGGAAEIVSWMSISTVAGLASSTLGALLGLGDHTHTALSIFRALGAVMGMFWLARMLLASLRGRIHPVGGFGVAMFFIVVFFPVVHPWYLLWAIVPLAAWANTRTFRRTAIAYSVLFSFSILPRGLGLQPTTVMYIYGLAAAIFAVLWLVGRRVSRVRALSL